MEKQSPLTDESINQEARELVAEEYNLDPEDLELGSSA
ncbi:hypothetical protein HRED_03789 [Candidatus Haloredivivus sp. G17]|nr:hypothetical protein HRED_03789 [Candidatus Haloredivivus sp. G17]